MPESVGLQLPYPRRSAGQEALSGSSDCSGGLTHKKGEDVSGSQRDL